MMKRDAGFTLVEALITIAIIGVIMAGASDMFITLLRSYKQQGKIAESNIEKIVGLELFRQDLNNAGFGLPGVIPTTVTTYTEAAGAVSSYNDTPNPPRAYILGLAADVTHGNSDILVLKATNITSDDVSQKWTYLQKGPIKKAWGTAINDLDNTDNVIIMSPGVTDGNRRSLVVDGTNWHTTFGSIDAFQPGTGATLAGTTSSSDTLIIYGINAGGTLRMPFNMAEYIISSTNVPLRCAPNTGVLTKYVVKQSDGTLDTANALPLLDCVANMQVFFRLDTNNDGVVDSVTNDLKVSGVQMTAQQIRDQVKEVRVYLLAHEGQRDSSYSHSPTSIKVGEGTNFAIGANVNYRWKVYTLAVKPQNLR